MMNGEAALCLESCELPLSVGGKALVLNYLVSDVVPGVGMLLGMDEVMALGGVCIGSRADEIRFLGGQATQVAAAAARALAVTDKDFSATFREAGGQCSGGGRKAPAPQINHVASYRIPDALKDEYDAEVGEWIDRGWLQPFEGECDGLIPLMVVFQANKDKVRPVMDFRELNQSVSSHTAGSDVCSSKIRSWRRMGSNVSIIDLRKDYLQIHVDPSLWKYQVVSHKGQRYCLTRLGFGLNVAPKIMTTILTKVLSMSPTVQAGTDSYVDDVVANNDLVTNEEMLDLLQRYGLEAKPPETLAGGRVLGLRVNQQHGKLVWRRDNRIEPLGKRVTRRQLFSWCGQLVGHFPVASWLRPACSYLKRRASNDSWDAPVEPDVRTMANEIQVRLLAEDPVCGDWVVAPTQKGQVWCDASSLAVGVALQIGDAIVEDAAWLRKPNDAAHINLAELEAVIKGLNLSLLWGLTEVEVMTDSANVYAWLRSLTEGDRPVRTHGLGEALTRRRLSLIADTIAECGLKVGVTLVRSADNKADRLTRVPQAWLRAAPRTGLETPSCAAVVYPQSIACFTESPSTDATGRYPLSPAVPEAVDLRAFHNIHHMGIDRTLSLARMSYPRAKITRSQVETVVRSCNRCRSVDRAPITWTPGTLEVSDCWRRLACDVTHYRGERYLTVVDCGPSRYAIWRRIPDEGAGPIAKNLEEIFHERGPPHEILLDNGASFHSDVLRRLFGRWGVAPIYPHGLGMRLRAPRSRA